MSYFFPVLTFMISIYLAGALVLYLLTTSLVAVIQQRAVLNQDDKELEGTPINQKEDVTQKLKNAKEASLVSDSKASTKKQRRNKT